MRLIFGQACDGRAYPDFPGGGDGAIGAAVVGPAGLVTHLELELGLSGPRAAEAVRVATYAAKLGESLTSQDAFFSASFAQDRWATAKTLLAWRDTLVGAGWSARAVGAPRLDALARAEHAGPPLPPGLCDRIAELLIALARRPRLDLASLALVEPRPLLAPAAARLIDALEGCGVRIEQTGMGDAARRGDLGRVQAYLSAGHIEKLQGDGSVVLLEADTSLMAAEAVAEWLAAGGEDPPAGSVVLCEDGDSTLLDRTFAAHGLPALGCSAPSPLRGALQVLPLAFAASWAPFDAKALLDLLLTPRPPIGRDAARQLARALAEEPGLGGPAWDRAWTRIETKLSQRFADDPKADEKVAERLTRWRDWMRAGEHDRAAGMPARSARGIAARVAAWAIQTDAGQGDPLMLSVAASARALAEAIDVLGQDLLPALLIERMIEQVLADGAANPLHVPTAGGLRGVTHPGAIWDGVDRLVWWDFKGPGERARSIPWDRSETARLAEAGCHLEPAARASARITWSQANALRRARDQVLLVRPARAGADETVSHPLAHQLAPLMPLQGSEADTALRFTAEQLWRDAHHDLGGRRLARAQATPRALPEPRAAWSLPSTAIARLTGRRESATSFEHLADCQLRWIIRDVLGLRRGRFAEIPRAQQLVGTLAHAIAKVVFRPGQAPDPNAAEREAHALFDGLLRQIAAPLQQPEFAGELAAARVSVPASLKTLAQMLRTRNLEIVGAELDRERRFGDDLAVFGRLDMVVRHPDEGLAVIDLKWTSSAKHRREELAKGRAIQLAAYGAIVDPDQAGVAPGAYYLLRQRRLFGPIGAIVSDEEVDVARSLGDTWRDLVRAWRIWRDTAAKGEAIATGLPDARDRLPPELPLAPSDMPCRYCEFIALCRVPAEVRNS